jgi:hypothetical protein
MSDGAIKALLGRFGGSTSTFPVLPEGQGALALDAVVISAC